MNEDCEKISCPVPLNTVQDYLNQYSLESVIISNAEYSAVINGVPVTIPAGTFTYSLSVNNVFGPLTFQGCSSVISVPIPPGSNFAQIQALVQQMLYQAAQQQAACNAAASRNLNPIVNSTVTYDQNCPPGSKLWINEPLMPMVQKSGNTLVVPSGVFSGSSASDANNRAENYLTQQVNKLISDNAIWCTCPDPNIIDTVISGFDIPSIGSTVTIQVSNSSNFTVNNPVDQLNGKFYVAFGIGAGNAMWFTVNSIPDSTHIVALRADDQGFLGGNGIIPTNSFISNGTNMLISSSQTLPQNVVCSFSFIENIVDCGGCATGGSAWDKQFHVFDFQSAGGHYISIHYRANGGTLNNLLLATGAATSIRWDSSTPFFILLITCSDGVNQDCPIWIGIKYSGNTPIGTYYDDSGSKICAVVSQVQT